MSDKKDTDRKVAERVSKQVLREVLASAVAGAEDVMNVTHDPEAASEKLSEKITDIFEATLASYRPELRPTAGDRETAIKLIADVYNIELDDAEEHLEYLDKGLIEAVADALSTAHGNAEQAVKAAAKEVGELRDLAAFGEIKNERIKTLENGIKDALHKLENAGYRISEETGIGEACYLTDDIREARDDLAAILEEVKKRG